MCVAPLVSLTVTCHSAVASSGRAVLPPAGFWLLAGTHCSRPGTRRACTPKCLLTPEAVLSPLGVVERNLAGGTLVPPLVASSASGPPSLGGAAWSCSRSRALLPWCTPSRSPPGGFDHWLSPFSSLSGGPISPIWRLSLPSVRAVQLLGTPGLKT